MFNTLPDLLIFLAAVLPLAVMLTGVFRLRNHPRTLMLNLCYLGIAMNEVFFLVYGRPFYAYHVFIDGFIISLGVMALILPDTGKLTYPVKYFFHQAFFYMGLFGVAAMSVVTPGRSSTLSAIVIGLVCVFGLVVLLQKRQEGAVVSLGALGLWAAAHLGMYHQPEIVNRLVTLTFFGAFAWQIIYKTLVSNLKLFSENKLLFKSRDVVLTMLNDIASSPDSLSSIDNTLNRVLKILTDTMSVEGAALYTVGTVEGEGTVLKYSQSTGVFYPLTPEDDFTLSKPQLILDHLEKSYFRKGDGVVGIVADTVEPLVLDRKTTSSRMLSLGLNTRVIRNLLAVPFSLKNELFGVFVIQNHLGEPMFSKEDVHLLHSLAEQAAMAVNNTSMYQELANTVRLRQETNIATRIQNQLLPTSVPVADNLRISPYIKPAKEVGGDYYDFIRHDDGSLGIAIGDVSGKGVPAGMIMAIAKVIVQIVAPNRKDVKEIIRLFTREIYQYMQRGQFMTVNYLRWEDAQRKLTFAGAGHEHVLWFHADTGQSERIKAGGLAAGLMEDPGELVKSMELNTARGDVIVLYTDGVTEARNGSKEMFTLSRLQASMESSAYIGDADKIRDSIMRDVNEFMGDTEQFDDITLMVLLVA